MTSLTISAAKSWNRAGCSLFCWQKSRFVLPSNLCKCVATTRMFLFGFLLPPCSCSSSSEMKTKAAPTPREAAAAWTVNQITRDEMRNHIQMQDRLNSALWSLQPRELSRERPQPEHYQTSSSKTSVTIYAFMYIKPQTSDWFLLSKEEAANY